MSNPTPRGIDENAGACAPAGQRYQIIMTSGRVRKDANVFVARAGDYDIVMIHENFVVVCDPLRRKKNRWNATYLTQTTNGGLTLQDTDVEPDPYHMCLIYQALENHPNRRKTDGIHK